MRLDGRDHGRARHLALRRRVSQARAFQPHLHCPTSPLVERLHKAFLSRSRAASGDAPPFITRQLEAAGGPIIAATDCVRAVPESVRAFIRAGRRHRTLGTDGFGRSDTRATLRRFFGVDAQAIANAARRALALG